jgi:hypothetical protein
MPLFHIHGLVAALLGSLTAGAAVACSPGFHQLRFFEWLAELGRRGTRPSRPCMRRCSHGRRSKVDCSRATGCASRGRRRPRSPSTSWRASKPPSACRW